ncbi:hypothetical protein K466DRAFT_533686 [Polyporus arcularius HHB13444]|uniref:Uncharacterized protein n=1 Tax=Polyporus arcularius HHB13444 TaxID=1314778 RepID=A0A5C3NTE2_9APHY|nr:hypothetical protein K466DRAFT_533686 [Polyporus arcularius HHB13444]
MACSRARDPRTTCVPESLFCTLSYRCRARGPRSQSKRGDLQRTLVQARTVPH